MAMDRDWEVQAERNKDRNYLRGVSCDAPNPPMGVGAGMTEQNMGTRRPTPAEEAEKNHYYYIEEAEKAGMEAKFLRENPAFSTFIDYIRRGIIRL